MFVKQSRAAACRAMEARLEDYVEGCLDRPGAGEVEAHARACPRCAAALESAQASAWLLAGLRARPLPEAGPHFARRVMARIREQRWEREQWKPLETAGRRLFWLAAAAALVLAVFVLRFQWAGPSPAGRSVAAQNQIEELINVAPSQPSVRDEALLVASRNAHAR